MVTSMAIVAVAVVAAAAAVAAVAAAVVVCLGPAPFWWHPGEDLCPPHRKATAHNALPTLE